MTDLLSTRREILALLNDNGIPYELHEHERAFTIDDCLRMPFIGACCRKQFLRHALFANKSREKRQHSVKSGNIASKSKHPKPKEV